MRPTTIANVRVPPARLVDLPEAIGAAHPATSAIALLRDNDVPIPERRTAESAPVYKFLDGEKLTRSDSQKLSSLLTLGNRRQNVALLAAMRACNPSFEPMIDLIVNGRPGRDAGDITREIKLVLKQASRELSSFSVRVSEHMSDDVLQKLENFHDNAASPINAVHVHFEEALQPNMANRERLSDWLRDCRGALECISGPSDVLHLIEESTPEIELHITDIDAEQPPGEMLNLTLRQQIGQLTLVAQDDDPQPLLHIATSLRAHNSHAGAAERLHAVELKGPVPDRCEQVVQDMMAIPHLFELTLPDPRWLQMPCRQLIAWAEGSSLRSLTISNRLDFDLDNNAPGGRHLRAHRRFGALAQRLSNILERNRVADRMVGIEVSKAFSRHAMDPHPNAHSHAFDDLTANTFVALLSPRDLKSMSLVNTATVTAVEEGHAAAEKVRGTVQGIPALATGPRAEVPPLPQEPVPPDHA